MHHAQENDQRPLVLLLAARRAERHPRLAVAQREAGRQRGARPLAAAPGCSASPSLQPEHLPARAHAEAEFRDHRRGLQPAAGRRGADHVAVRSITSRWQVSAPITPSRATVGSPAPGARSSQHGARVGGVVIDPSAYGRASCRAAAPAMRCGRPACGVPRCSRPTAASSSGTVDEIRIAVIGLAIGVGELGAFHHGVDELGAERIHRADIEAAQQRELLQEHRPLAPRSAFQHGVAVIVVARPAPPPSPTSAAKSSAASRPRWRRPVTSSTSVVRKKRSTASATKPRYQALRAASMRASRVAAGRLAADALARSRPAPGGRTARPGAGTLPPGRNTAAERFPFLLEQRPHALDRGADARHDVDAVRRVADGERQHVGKFPGAPVAQQQAPGVERAGHHRRQQAGRRDQIEVRGRGTSPASRPAARRPGRRSPAASGVRAECRMIGASPPGPFRCGSATCRVNAAAAGGVERVAAAFQHRHADLAGDPVRAGDHAEGAGDFRAGGEHANSRGCIARRLAAGCAPSTQGTVGCWCWWSARAGPARTRC